MTIEELNKMRINPGELGYKALTGSPKQIAWAEKIRNEKIQYAADSFNLLIDNEVEKAIADEEGREAKKAAIIAVAGHGEAKWWIDNRFRIGEEIAKEYKNRRTGK